MHLPHKAAEQEGESSEQGRKKTANGNVIVHLPSSGETKSHKWTELQQFRSCFSCCGYPPPPRHYAVISPPRWRPRPRWIARKAMDVALLLCAGVSRREPPCPRNGGGTVERAAHKKLENLLTSMKSAHAMRNTGSAQGSVQPLPPPPPACLLPPQPCGDALISIPLFSLLLLSTLFS